MQQIWKANYKIRYDLVGKVTHSVLCKKFKFDRTNMHNSVSVLENKTLKLLWDFGIKTHHLISGRQTDHIIIYQKRKT